jgi:hypothetical protein
MIVMQRTRFVEPKATRAGELEMRLRVTAIIVFVLAWVSWAYERATGLTFVLSRRYTHLGAISN